MHVANSELVWLVNHKPRILHLPDTVRRREVSTPLGVIEQVLPMNDGVPVPPSVAREKDGAPQPTAVDRKLWDRVKSNKQVQTWMRLGWLTVAEHDAPGTDEPDSLAKYNEATAVALVEGCESPKLLGDWAATEQRPSVKHALETRLETITAPLPPLAANGRRGNR